jgi:hypothetical protein
MEIMGFQIKYVGVRQQARKPVDDGLAVLFTDTDIDCHVFPLTVMNFSQQVPTHSSKPAALPQPRNFAQPAANRPQRAAGRPDLSSLRLCC